MSMTPEQAKNLLEEYHDKLNSVHADRKGLDITPHSPSFLFIPNLLDALSAIAYPNDAMAEKYSILVSSVSEKNPTRNGCIPETTLEYFARAYEAPELVELQKKIRELISAAPAPAPAPDVAAPADADADVVADAPAPSPAPEMPATREPETEVMTDWSYWLRCGLLGASLVASLALCVYAASAPVILGVGLLAVVGSGLALAGTLGFFNNNSETNDANTHEDTLSCEQP